MLEVGIEHETKLITLVLHESLTQDIEPTLYIRLNKLLVFKKFR